MSVSKPLQRATPPGLVMSATQRRRRMKTPQRAPCTRRRGRLSTWCGWDLEESNSDRRNDRQPRDRDDTSKALYPVWERTAMSSESNRVIDASRTVSLRSATSHLIAAWRAMAVSTGSTVPVALATCLVSWCAVAAHAQTICDIPNNIVNPADAFGYSSQAANPPLCTATNDPFESVCWLGVSEILGVGSWGGCGFPDQSGIPTHFEGFEFNLDLYLGPTPGDYPPVSLDATASTSPLVARAVPHYPGPVPYPERPTVQGVVDLITGSPLLRSVDLSLPFGSAVYRHVRTFAEPPDAQIESSCVDLQATSYPPPGPHRYAINSSMQFWDWHGQGWMMGENPIFLIDARYLGFDDNIERRRCYFIPDAHHSIPFRMIDEDTASPRYVAPPSFDAILDYKHEGV